MATLRQIISDVRRRVKALGNDSVLPDAQIAFWADNNLAMLIRQSVEKNGLENVESDYIVEYPCLPIVLEESKCFGECEYRYKIALPFVPMELKEASSIVLVQGGANTYIQLNVGHRQIVKHLRYVSLYRYYYRMGREIYLEAEKGIDLSKCKFTISAVSRPVGEDGKVCCEDCLDSEYPMPKDMVEILIQLCTKTATQMLMIPQDKENDGSDKSTQQ